MLKTIIKEFMITLLLCVAILFILGVLFYDYNPMNKVVPNKIAYSAPENIKKELEEENIESSISIENKVYTIEGSDLNIYKKKNSYNPSKQNPFASTTSEDANVTISTNDVKTNNINTSGNQNTGLK